jgi:AraC-like DNA-binding protein
VEDRERQAQLDRWHAELAAIMERHTGTDGKHATLLPGLSFIRASAVSEPIHSVYDPALCLVAQGAKQVILGRESYSYDPASYLVASVQLPIMGQVIEAEPEKPYLSLQLRFSPAQIAELTALAAADPDDKAHKTSQGTGRGLYVSSMKLPLLDAVVRLVRLLDSPQDIPVLAPLAMQEILYRLIQDEQGAVIKQFAAAGSHAGRIRKVIDLINERFSEPLRVEQLAEAARMSASSMHYYFKEVTSMSPLQYQKRIRLQQARRLLLYETDEAADAAFQVGYESPSQFSREYARMFGLPPISDIRRLRH